MKLKFFKIIKLFTVRMMNMTKLQKNVKDEIELQ